MGFFDDVGSFLFGGNNNTPEYNKNLMPGHAIEAINRVDNQSVRSDEDLGNTIMEGVSGTGQGLLQNEKRIGDDESALGMMSSDSQRQALANRNQRIYKEDLNTMQRAVPQAAAEWHEKRLEQSQRLQQARDSFNMDVAGAEIQSVLNQRAARNAIISDILGVAGMAAGYGLAGGFSGAAAGSGAGAGAGASGSGGASVAGGAKMTPYDWAKVGGKAGYGDGGGGVQVNRDYSGR